MVQPMTVEAQGTQLCRASCRPQTVYLGKRYTPPLLWATWLSTNPEAEEQRHNSRRRLSVLPTVRCELQYVTQWNWCSEPYHRESYPSHNPHALETIDGRESSYGIVSEDSRLQMKVCAIIETQGRELDRGNDFSAYQRTGGR